MTVFKLLTTFIGEFIVTHFKLRSVAGHVTLIILSVLCRRWAGQLFRILGKAYDCGFHAFQCPIPKPVRFLHKTNNSPVLILLRVYLPSVFWCYITSSEMSTVTAEVFRVFLCPSTKCFEDILKGTRSVLSTPFRT